MENDLISKKELLSRYGISYGALYRWKRKGLIPEDWFLRRSTSTGQETFFAREAICARVEEILAQKDEASLDELAKRFDGGSGSGGTLILRTRYGEKSVRVADVQSIIYEPGRGSEADLTGEILKILRHWEEQ